MVSYDSIREKGSGMAERTFKLGGERGGIRFALRDRAGTY